MKQVPMILQTSRSKKVSILHLSKFFQHIQLLGKAFFGCCCRHTNRIFLDFHQMAFNHVKFIVTFAKLYVQTWIVELYISIRSAAKFENFYMYTTAINNLGKVSFHTKYNQDKFCSWYNCTLSSNFPVFPICAMHDTNMQGGRSWGVAVGALPERSGSSTKGRIPNIRYFGAKLFSRFTRFLNQRHRGAFNESHPAFVELSTRFILLL